MEIVLCSECFIDEGLRIDSMRIGKEEPTKCPHCSKTTGVKLNIEMLEYLAQSFFIRGTMHKVKYGTAPIITYNPHHFGNSSINPSTWLKQDVELLGNILGIGFFHYGPRLWMVGEIEPLKELIKPTKRKSLIDKVVSSYPSRKFARGESFYRIRVNPQTPQQPEQYDSPPDRFLGHGRLDSANFPVLYGSQDTEVCIHECRVSVEDEIYMATIEASKDLCFLDLTEILSGDGTEFESLDLAIHFLFLAGKHSYKISRDIAKVAKSAGYDGIIYPSYFSLVRTGAMPFETVLGISIRKLGEFKDRAQGHIIQNMAIFGRPIKDGMLHVRCINRAVFESRLLRYQFWASTILA